MEILLTEKAQNGASVKVYFLILEVFLRCETKSLELNIINMIIFE